MMGYLGADEDQEEYEKADVNDLHDSYVWRMTCVGGELLGAAL